MISCKKRDYIVILSALLGSKIKKERRAYHLQEVQVVRKKGFKPMDCHIY